MVPLASNRVGQDRVPERDRAEHDRARRADPNQVDQVLSPQAVHDRVVLHSNVRAFRLSLLLSSGDLAAEALRIGNSAVSSICPAIVISVAKVPSLTAGSNNLVLRHPEPLAKALGLLNDAIKCPTVVRNRWTTGWNNAKSLAIKSGMKPPAVTNFRTNGGNDTRIRRMAAGGTPKNMRPFIGDEEAAGLA